MKHILGTLLTVLMLASLLAVPGMASSEPAVVIDGDVFVETMDCGVGTVEIKAVPTSGDGSVTMTVSGVETALVPGA